MYHSWSKYEICSRMGVFSVCRQRVRHQHMCSNFIWLPPAHFFLFPSSSSLASPPLPSPLPAFIVSAPLVFFPLLLAGQRHTSTRRHLMRLSLSLLQFRDRAYAPTSLATLIPPSPKNPYLTKQPPPQTVQRHHAC